MKILALDLGTHLGWATDASGRLEWGQHEFRRTRGDSPGIIHYQFNHWLERMCFPHGRGVAPAFGFVIYEQPHLRGGAATDILVGQSTRIMEFCALNRQWKGGSPQDGGHSAPLDHASIHTSELKKFATGKGNSDKDAMRLTCGARLHRQFSAWEIDVAKLTDNEADALWLYWYAQNLIGYPTGKGAA